MVKYIFKIGRFFNIEKLKNDKRTIVFAACLLIATTLWFLNALGKNYATTLSYPVKYINSPDNQFLANTPPSKFQLHVEAYGFTLLRHKLAFSFSPILLNLTTMRQNMPEESNTMTVRTEDLIRQISEQISKEVNIIDVTPRTFTLIFDSLQTKKVRVNPDFKITLKSQFYISDSIVTNPPEVYITGPAGILDSLNFVVTEHEIFNDISSGIEKQVCIVTPSGTKTDPAKVTLIIPVEKFTEKEIKIPVKIKPDQYASVLKLFPSEVTVSFMVSLSNYENISENDFEAFVNYEPESGGSETLEVKIESHPPGIEKMHINPGSVEFLIETN
jgi:hypothetical protein